MNRHLCKITSRKATIYIILAICFVLRAAFAWHNRHLLASGDGALYSAIAHSIEAGNGVVWHYRQGGPLVPTAWGCPLYPTFLAIIYRLFSTSPLAVYLVQAILDTLTCFFVFRIALSCTKNSTVAVFSALGYAFYIPFITMIITFWADSVGYFTLAAAILAFVTAKKKSGWYFALAGVLMGISILVKPMLLLFPVFLAVMLLIMRNRGRSFVFGAAVLVITSYLIVAPWTVRNYLVFHRFIPIASHGGQTLWGGTGPADGHTMTSWNAPIDNARLNLIKDPRVPDVSDATYHRLIAFQNKLAGMDEIQRNDALMKAAKDEIKQHPKRYAILAVKKFFRLWFHLFQDAYGSKLFLLIAVVNATLLFLAALSYKNLPYRFLFWTTLNLAIYTSISSMVAFSHIRYSYSVFPFIIILAVVGAFRLLGVDESVEAREKLTAGCCAEGAEYN